MLMREDCFCSLLSFILYHCSDSSFLYVGYVLVFSLLLYIGVLIYMYVLMVYICLSLYNVYYMCFTILSNTGIKLGGESKKVAFRQ